MISWLRTMAIVQNIHDIRIIELLKEIGLPVIDRIQGRFVVDSEVQISAKTVENLIEYDTYIFFIFHIINKRNGCYQSTLSFKYDQMATTIFELKFLGYLQNIDNKIYNAYIEENYL